MALYVIPALLVIVIVLAAIAPKSYNIQRSILIDMPKEMVFAHVNMVRNHKIGYP